MPSLTQKIIGGQKYFYARICKRVDHKPKIVQTIYLGTIEKLIANAAQSTAPKPADVYIAEFGASAALFDIAQRLRLVAIIDKHSHKRRQGPSIGQYMLIAAINRATRPTSKSLLADWFAQTIGPRLLGVSPDALSSQAFWNHMHGLSGDALSRIEDDLLHCLLDEFKLDVNCLLYDATNFHTYINTRTQSVLAQRGHNKQKRNDLRQISLGMMTAADFNIPLLHIVYGGNIGDSTQFSRVIDELLRRYRLLTAACPNVTLVFDKGNNSEDNLVNLPQTGFHFVGSLRLNQCADLLQIPLRSFRQLPGDDLADVKAFRTQRVVFAAERTVLVTFNEKLLTGQLQGIACNVQKTKHALHELQSQLRRWANGKIKKGRKPSIDSVRAKVNKILAREFMKEIVSCDIAITNDLITLQYAVNPDAIAKLSRTVLGKTILFTDNHDWSDEQIIHAYRAQYHIEHGFRDMKNPFCLGWNPRHHWTDHNIRIHAFYCVVALTLVSLLRRELAAKGIDISAERLMENLGSIRQTISVYPSPNSNKPRLATALSHMNPLQKQLFDLLNLSRFQSI